MVEYNSANPSQSEVIAHANSENLGVLIKKGLGSGTLPAAEAIPFCLERQGVCSVVVGSLHPQHISENLRVARDFLK
jgi:predicted aldo/keto reductase-like oxidoreductase